MPNPIKIGTRKSKLALWQANWVKMNLEHAGIASELITMETKSDQMLDVAIADIGTKGVFTEELEVKLANGDIDIAVHSAKDMQSVLPSGFEIIAFGPREQSHDVLVSHRKVNLATYFVIGTSSARRTAFVKHFYPHIDIVEMRGNLQTRISKMEHGICDALILAYAGVHRMALDALIQETLDPEQWIPAVGQGSIAIEAHHSIDSTKKKQIISLINHLPTQQLLLAERAYLEKFEGGCSIPVFARATYRKEMIELIGGIISLNGQQKIVRSVVGKDPLQLGLLLAHEVIIAGGTDLLIDIKKQMKK